MSKLENRVKPLLLSLAVGTRGLDDLSHPEQRTLSRWAAKTALVLNAASGFITGTFLQIHYDSLRVTSVLPQGVSVFAFQTPDVADDLLAVTAMQSNHWLVIHKVEPAILDFPQVKISLRVGRLQLLMAYVARPDWSVVSWKGVHCPLWPTRIGLWYDAALHRNFVKPSKESGTVLFHISLGITNGLTQGDIDSASRPPLEATLEALFKTFGGSVERIP